MGEMAQFFKSLLQIMTFCCFSFGPSPKMKKKKTKMFDQHLNQAEEIIVEILMRLPVLSLVRFKCASKYWKTLISSQYFKAKHLHHAKSNEKILISRFFIEIDTSMSYHCSSLSSLSSSSSSFQPLQELVCPSKDKPCLYMILCCNDGLALLKYRGRRDLLLWNPSTNESVQLPNNEFPEAMNPTYGLGYDSISDDYKILKTYNTYYRSGLLIPPTISDDYKILKTYNTYYRPDRLIPPNNILALKSGSWRKLNNHPRAFRNCIAGGSSLAFFRGAFHWICEDNLPKYFMVSFNISNEVYGEIPLSDRISNSFYDYARYGVSVMQGMLCSYCTYYDDTDTETYHFKLWVMKEYGIKESWTELFTIRNKRLHLVIPKYIFPDGEVLLYYREILDGKFRTSKGPYELLPSSGVILRGFTYTESLISPKLLLI